MTNLLYISKGEANDNQLCSSLTNFQPLLALLQSISQLLVIQ